MIRNRFITSVCILAAITAGMSTAWAAKRDANKQRETVSLTPDGERLQTQYAAMLTTLQGEITRALPVVSEQKKSALQKARAALKRATSDASDEQQPLNEVHKYQGLVEHAKGKWIKGAEKGIKEAEAALKKATTPAERAAAQQELAKWQANKEEGLKALKERQAALDRAKANAASASKAVEAAKTALAKAQADESNAARALLADVTPFLASDKLDAKLVKAAVLAHATPRGLAAFAQQGPEQAALVGKLLADDKLMKEMLIAGGASYGHYGRAMEIYTAIQKASPKAGEGVLQRLALAVALEHAQPIRQSNAAAATDAPDIVDPVKRYQHYEKAYLAGELDPAFKTLNTWELRMVVDCDAPDHILAWGREMLRTYRPDHISNPHYGWRYVSLVKTDVRYGSQNVKNDLPTLHLYQNIPKDGGVCGRRAFFGRFILRAFGIPTWGVTQHAHAALSHWTPKGWVINLGAGFNHSWWDKDEVSRSGSDFLLETQARARGPEYLKVLRAQWVSRVLGEPAYNDRKKVDGGFWSQIGHYQMVALASQAVALGPLGQELAEANVSEDEQIASQAPVTTSGKLDVLSKNNVVVIPAAAHSRSTGRAATMKSYSGGLQIHCGGGFQARYAFDAPQAGKYALTARVATLQEGQVFLFSVDNGKGPVEVAVPYTTGLWQQTPPVEVVLARGQNTLQFAVKEGSRGVTIKDFTLTLVK